MAVGNSLPAGALQWLHPGLRFSQQTLLRLGIILYGVRLTVRDLANLRPRALALDLTVIGSVLVIGYWIVPGSCDWTRIRWAHRKAAGTKPLLLALIIFSGLIWRGWIMTRLLV